MTQRDRIVKYVLDHGPCTDEAISLHAAKVGAKEMRRALSSGAPDGMVACELLRGNDYTFVIAKQPPEGFSPIKIRGRQASPDR